MRTGTILAVFVLAFGAQEPRRRAAAEPGAAGIRLQDVSWSVAESRLSPHTVVILPLGGGAVEHGPHLTLGNDLKLAEYFAGRIAADTDVVVAPALPCHHDPAFLEYPGSTSLSLGSTRDSLADIARSLVPHGPRRLYVLNTSLSAEPALSAAAKAAPRPAHRSHREAPIVHPRSRHPPVEGLCALVLKKRGGWAIEAYRYSMKGAQNITKPTLLPRPGYPGRE